LQYWRAYTMYATSYTASSAGTPRTSPWYGYTASGMKLTKGIVAIDRRYIPFGTRMYVPGYGFAVAGDTGGGVKGRWIDLGFDEDNYVGWHQTVMVYFLAPAPSADQIRWIIPSTVP
jgi:3D (Asp-Asp-Asp) domain-containing protein